MKQHLTTHIVAACLLSACGPTKEKHDPVDTPWGTGTDGADGGQITNVTADSDSDGGADSTGGGDQVVEDACLLDAQPGFFGYVHQCGGTLAVNFSAAGMASGDAFEFGHGVDGDFYATPKVMACCDPFELPMPGEGFWDQPHAKACVADLVEQACRSVTFKIQDAAEDFPVTIANQAIALSNWVASAEGQESCRDAFWIATGASEATEDVDLALSGARWDLPNDSKWKTIKDPFAVVVNLEILDIYPTEDDGEMLLECLSGAANNDVSFVQAVPGASTPHYKLNAATVSLAGPKYDGQTITGNGALASAGTSCTACSRAAMKPSGTQQLMVEMLDLRSAAPVNVGTPATHVTLDRYWVSLYEPVAATRLTANQYRIPAGEDFLLSTTFAGAAHIIPAKNSTPITVTVGPAATTMGAFQIAYTDVSGALWKMTVNASSWQRQ